MTVPQPAGDENTAIQHYIVQCRDAAHSAEVRAAALPAHRAYVDTRDGSIVLSGPLVDDNGELRIGQFYVLRVETRSDAEEFIAEDPFTKAGIFASVEVTRLQLRFLNGHRADA